MNPTPYSSSDLKYGTWNFLTGKVASGLFTFLNLLLLVRILNVIDYGAYVTFLAVLELTWAISGLGLPWVAARYLPEFRLNASSSDLKMFSWKLASISTATHTVAAILALLLLDAYLSFLELSFLRNAALFFVMVMLFEGMGRFARDSLLSPLLLQRQVRASLVIRQLAFFILIIVVTIADEGKLKYVAMAELAASTVGAFVAINSFRQYLSSLNDKNANNDWLMPRMAPMWRTARDMYGAHLLSLIYSPQVFLQIIHRVLGYEATAVFGFLRSLYTQISNHLPATLLFNLIRPKLVAGYVGGGGMNGLKENTNLGGKLSLFVLMPVIAFAFDSSERIVLVLSGGKFPDTGFLLLGFLLILVPLSQRQLLETVAVACGCSKFCIIASLSGLLMVPALLIMLSFGFGLWSAVVALFAGHLLFDVIIICYLGSKTAYRIDGSGFLKLLYSTTLTCTVAIYLPNLHYPFLDFLITGIFCFFIYLFISWLIKPFSDLERMRLNNLIGYRFFVW